MLWNKDFLFLHYPKTAGKSLSLAFAEVWARPVFGLVSRGQISELSGLDQEGLHLTVARGHETIAEAKNVLWENGIDIHRLKAIFVGIRNPYELMVSNYFFMRKTYADNADRPNFVIAMENNFETYCARISMTPPSQWMELEGREPENLVLLRHEKLQEDFDRAAERFGFSTVKLPHLNKSEHEQYQNYLTKQAEDKIYAVFSDIFDRGLYPRFKVPSILS